MSLMLVAALTLLPMASEAQRPARRPNRTIRVFVDGSQVRFDRVKPLNVGRRVVVPLRGVFEKMGANVTYDALNQTVYARRGGTRVKLKVGSRTAYVNGRPRRLDAYSRISKGHVLVPIRFVAETLDAGVAYVAPQYVVRIRSHKS